jgi:hypothetical protein
MLSNILRSASIPAPGNLSAGTLYVLEPGTETNTFTFNNVDFGDYYTGRTVIISSIVSSLSSSGPSSSLTIAGVSTTHTLSAGNFVPAGAAILAFSTTREFTGRTGTVVLTADVPKTLGAIAVYTTPRQVSLVPVATNSDTGSSQTTVSFSSVTTQAGDIVLGMGSFGAVRALTYAGGLVQTGNYSVTRMVESSAIASAPASTRTISCTWSPSTSVRWGYGIFR